MPRVRAVSKRHTGKAFLYWWDVWDDRKRKIKETGGLILCQQDTLHQAVITPKDCYPLD